MKTIVCPTTNSQMARNAVRYATSISYLTEAELRLLDEPFMENLFINSQRVLSTIQPLAPNGPTRAERIATPKSLAAYLDPTVQIQTVCKLAGHARNMQADLMVLGVEKEFSLYDMYNDSIVNLVKQAHCPALFIPESSHFQPIKRI